MLNYRSKQQNKNCMEESVNIVIFATFSSKLYLQKSCIEFQNHCNELHEKSCSQKI